MIQGCEAAPINRAVCPGQIRPQNGSLDCQQFLPQKFWASGSFNLPSKDQVLFIGRPKCILFGTKSVANDNLS